MDIQCKVGDALDLQSGGGTAGATMIGALVHPLNRLNQNNNYSAKVEAWIKL